MDFASAYEIARTADFIRSGNFARVALQFPDDLLKESPLVVRALREEVALPAVRFYVLADTTYGSCCVDEVAASHVQADCVVHYGHACMTPTSNLPALFVFGNEIVDVDACLESLRRLLSTGKKSILVLFALECAHAISTMKNLIAAESLGLDDIHLRLVFAKVACNSMKPSGVRPIKKTQANLENEASANSKVHDDGDNSAKNSHNGELCQNTCIDTDHTPEYRLGGLTWTLPKDSKMVDYTVFWIGPDNSAFANVVLTFNTCDIVRFEARENCLMEDTTHLKKILKRRYYLVEKAKDANIVGILVGTLGVADYLKTVRQVKELIEGAGKKSYTLVMGRPNPAKLANFPECDVFVYISCAQTALLDSKEFLAPVITPYEAMLAFNRDSKWTGEYLVDFWDVKRSLKPEGNGSTEARFSFLKGGYVEDSEFQDGEKDGSIVLLDTLENTLSLKAGGKDAILFKGEAKTASEYLVARSYRGLEIKHKNSGHQSVIAGRTGRACRYENEES